MMGPLLAIQFALGLVGLHIGIGWIPVAAICVMRLHDLGRTGKWVLLPLSLSVIGTFAAVGAVPAHQLPTAVFAMDAAVLLLIIWLGSEPGEPISNNWGGPARAGFSFGKTDA